jgi:hypothetical protein
MGKRGGYEGGPIISPLDPGQDAEQITQQDNSGAAEIVKWILIAVFALGGAMSNCAPIGGIVLFVGYLLTFGGSAHQGGNDSRENNKK